MQLWRLLNVKHTFLLCKIQNVGKNTFFMQPPFPGYYKCFVLNDEQIIVIIT